MSNIIPVQFKNGVGRGALNEDLPHLVGVAKCLDCGVEWQAVAEVGTTHLECPQCKTSRGVLAGPVEPKTGQQWFTCNCDNRLFHIVADERGKFLGCMCIKCGKDAVFE